MRRLFEESGLFESIPDEKELDKMFNDSSPSLFEGDPQPFVTKNGFNVYFQKSLFPQEVILKVCRNVNPDVKSIALEKEVLLSYVEFSISRKADPFMLSMIREETELWGRTIEELKSLGVGFPVAFISSGNDFLFNLERIGTDWFNNAKTEFYFKGRADLCSKGKYRQSFIGMNGSPTFKECLMNLLNDMENYSMEVFSNMPPVFRDWLIGK